MIVEKNPKSAKSVQFLKLPLGAYFVHDRDGEVYQKLSNNYGELGCSLNVVRESPMITENSADCFPLKCKLVVIEE